MKKKLGALMALLLLMSWLTNEPEYPNTTIMWSPGPVLNQNGLPQCVPYAIHTLLQAAPHRLHYLPSPGSIYYGARSIESRAPHTPGTTVQAAFKYMQNLGLVDDWRYSWSIQTASKWFDYGPVLVVGRWRVGMYPEEFGYIRTVGTPFSSAHAITCYGLSTDKDWFCQNTWGPVWGYGGRMVFSYADMDRFGADFFQPKVSSQYTDYWSKFR